MNALQEALARERCTELRRQAADGRLRRHAVAARRARRRGGPTTRRDRRSDYGLAAR